jgi:hypothetical protein
MIAALATAVAMAAQAPPLPDPPGTVVARVDAPTQVAARDGVAVFGSTDPATNATTLIRRDAAGALGAVGVPAVPVPAFPSDRYLGVLEPPAFEVTLGAGPQGRLTAVYLRCPAPARSSCRLALGDVATGAEQLVDGTGRALRGAVAGSRIVFVRRDVDGIERLYATRTTGGSPVALRLPRLVKRSALGRRRAQPVVRRDVRIAAVDVRGDDVVYVLNFPLPGTPELAESQLWLDRGSAAPRMIARVGTGGASAGFREFVGPRLERSSVVAYRQGRDQGSSVQRFSLRGRLLGSATLSAEPLLELEVTGGTYDRGHYWYSVNPYQGTACARFDFDEPRQTGTCPVLDFAPLRLAAPARRR